MDIHNTRGPGDSWAYGPRSSRRGGKKISVPLIAALTATFLMLGTSLAFASVWTDQADYSPGSVVTISGDNSNGAGYLAGETVAVSVSGPNGYTASCEAVADDNGAWSCQVTLWDSELAVGEYTYTATGQTSGVSETGTFTDAIQTQTTVTSSLNPSNVGDSVTFTATVKSATGSPPSFTQTVTQGQIKFGTGANCEGDFTQLQAAASVNTSGQVAYTTSSLAAGITTIRACYLGFGSGSTALQKSDGTVAQTVNPVAPTNSPPAVAASNTTVTVDEGQTANNSGTWSDANADDTVTLTASVGTILKSGTNAGGTWSWSFGTSDGPDDNQTVTISAFDGTATTSTTFSLVVNNVPPTVTFDPGLDTTVDESGITEHTYSYTISDPGADTVKSVSVSCGTGGTLVSGSATNTDTAGSFKCKFLDGPASPNVTAQATDSDGAAGNTASLPVTVNNVKPTVTMDSLTGNAGTACIGGNTVTLGFSWTDPAGTNDTYSYDVDWGDNSTHDTAGSPGATLVYGDSPVAGLTHTYAAGGPYTIDVTVNDSDTGDGTTVSSNPFSFLYNTSGILQPINPGPPTSIFKYKSTIPVKIKVFDCNGTPVGTLAPNISVQKLNGSTPSGVEEASSTSAADSGTTMRWSGSPDYQYIYNLATKPLNDSSATYQIKITDPTIAPVYATFGLKP